MKVFKIILDSYRQALLALVNNRLRTVLSLLGICIGIFCIVAVQSAVDSLENTIKNGFSELGSDVIYVQEMPWDEDPGENYWKYMARPPASYDEYLAIKERGELHANVAFTLFIGNNSIKHQNNSVENIFVMGSSYDYKEIQKLEFSEGRYFSKIEDRNGVNKVIIGNQVKEELFGKFSAIGQKVKVLGKFYEVIGVIEKEGENMFNFIDFDDAVFMNLNHLRRYYNTSVDSPVGRLLSIQARPDVELSELKDELTGILRASRRIKPIEENNFSLNEISLLTKVLDKVFGVMNIVGMIIGIFALIVGMFSVANIMFVSVKERTKIIGTKKALGATKTIILMEFLFEAVILCLIGGIIGIILVYILMTGLDKVVELNLGLSTLNIIIGVGSSIIVGLLAGTIPAYFAARLDPVVAIRQ